MSVRLVLAARLLRQEAKLQRISLGRPVLPEELNVSEPPPSFEIAFSDVPSAIEANHSALIVICCLSGIKSDRLSAM